MSNNSAKLATLVTKGQPEKGRIVRLFKITCGVCEGDWTDQADSFEGFCKLIEGAFHLSVTHGWVHHTCQKRMPANLSLKRNVDVKQQTSR